MRNAKPLFILVGGFLGAGKTSLIACAAEMLVRLGKRVAVITNDQGENLVDTRRIRATGIDAAEVAGGCLCCRFSEFMEVSEQMERFHPEFIFAEPVGSCTGLAVSIMQPLVAYHSDRFRVAPLTVLVDPEIGRRVAASPLLKYLFEAQVAEADIVCYSKADRYPDAGGQFRLSTVTGQGVAEWLELVTAWEQPIGSHPLELDFDRYAAAEASMGWLNAVVAADLTIPASPAQVIGPILEALEQAFTKAGIDILHLKLYDEAPSSYLKAAITANGQTPVIEGDMLAPAQRQHEMLLNLRAVAPPQKMRRIVERVIWKIPGIHRLDISAFTPSYPIPQYGGKRASARGASPST